MSESKFYLKPLPPSTAVQKFVEVAKEVSPGHSVKSFTVNTPLGSTNLVEGQLPIGDLPNQSVFAGRASQFSGRDFLELFSISLYVADGWNLSYLDQPGEDPHLKLVVNPDDSNKALRVADAIDRAFNLVRHSEFGSTRLPADQLEA